MYVLSVFHRFPFTTWDWLTVAFNSSVQCHRTWMCEHNWHDEGPPLGTYVGVTLLDLQELRSVCLNRIFILPFSCAVWTVLAVAKLWTVSSYRDKYLLAKVTDVSGDRHRRLHRVRDCVDWLLLRGPITSHKLAKLTKTASPVSSGMESSSASKFPPQHCHLRPWSAWVRNKLINKDIIKRLCLNLLVPVNGSLWPCPKIFSSELEFRYISLSIFSLAVLVQVRLDPGQTLVSSSVPGIIIFALRVSGVWCSVRQ